MYRHPTVILLWELLTKGSGSLAKDELVKRLCDDVGIATVLKSSKEAQPLSNNQVIEDYLGTKLRGTEHLELDHFVELCASIGHFETSKNIHEANTDTKVVESTSSAPSSRVSGINPEAAGVTQQQANRALDPCASQGLPTLLNPRVRDSIERTSNDFDDEQLYKDIILASRSVYSNATPESASHDTRNYESIGHRVGKGHTVYQHPYVNLDALDDQKFGGIPKSYYETAPTPPWGTPPLQAAQHHTEGDRKAVTSASSALPSSSLYIPSFDPAAKSSHPEVNSMSNRQQIVARFQQSGETAPREQQPQVVAQTPEKRELSPNEVFLHFLIRQQAIEIEKLKADYTELKEKSEVELLEERAMAEEAIHRLKESHREQLGKSSKDLEYVRESCTFLQRLLKDMRKEHGVNTNGRRAATDLIDQMLHQLGNNNTEGQSASHRTNTVLPHLGKLQMVSPSTTHGGSNAIQVDGYAKRSIHAGNQQQRSFAVQKNMQKSINALSVSPNLTHVGKSLTKKRANEPTKLKKATTMPRTQQQDGNWVPSLTSPASPVTAAMKKLWVFQQAHFA